MMSKYSSSVRRSSLSTPSAASGLYHDVALVVDNCVELLGGKSKQVSYFVRQRAEIPDVSHGHYQLDMAHALAAYLLFGHHYTASVAYDAFVADAFVLSAMALVVLYGAEYLLAEEAVAFGLVCAVVDGFEGLRTSPLDFSRISSGEASPMENFGETGLCLVVFSTKPLYIYLSYKDYCSKLMLRPRPRNSWRRTLSDSGMPGVGMGSPLTIDS